MAKELKTLNDCGAGQCEPGNSQEPLETVEVGTWLIGIGMLAFVQLLQGEENPDMTGGYWWCLEMVKKYEVYNVL